MASANAFSTAVGGFEVEIPYEGEATFVVTGEAITYTHESGMVSGTGNVTLTRDLNFGDQGGVNAKIASGATATVIVEESKLKEVTAGLDYTVQEPAGHIGSGNLTFGMAEGDAITAEATFTLETDYGFPDRAAGPVVIKEGASVKAVINGTFDSATLEKTDFFALNPAGEGQGKIDGWMDGTLAFEGMKLDVTAAAALSEDWPLPAEWGTVTLKEGSELTSR